MQERDAVRAEVAIESLRIAGRLRFRAQGSSMLPAIRPGSAVEIDSVEPSTVGPGDVVLTRTPAGLRLHRLAAIRQAPSGLTTFVTRGDNHTHDDPPVPASQVLGKLRPRRSGFADLLSRLWRTQ